jgi:hypothetical protein
MDVSDVNPYAAPRPAIAEISLERSPPPTGPLTGGIRFAGRVTWADFRKAQRLHVGQGRWLVRLVLIGLWAVLAATALGGELAWFYWTVIGATCFFMVVARWRVRLSWQRFRLEGRPFERILAEEGVESNTPESRQTMRWTFFSKYRLSDDMLLLYWDPPTMYWYCPRRFFACEDDWLAALDLVARNLPPG